MQNNQTGGDKVGLWAERKGDESSHGREPEEMERKQDIQKLW